MLFFSTSLLVTSHLTHLLAEKQKKNALPFLLKSAIIVLGCAHAIQKNKPQSIQQRKNHPKFDTLPHVPPVSGWRCIYSSRPTGVKNTPPVYRVLYWRNSYRVNVALFDSAWFWWLDLRIWVNKELYTKECFKSIECKGFFEACKH